MKTKNKPPGAKRFLYTSLFLALSILLTLSMMGQAMAATYTITAVYTSFTTTNINDWSLVGATMVDTGGGRNSMRLTDNINDSYGTAWWDPQVGLFDEGSFSALISFQMRQQGGGGADGLCFAIQPNSNAEGSPGQGLGFGGIANSFAVEFDTWQNADEGDPDANHIGVDLDGSVTSVATASLAASLETNYWWAWIDYDGLNDHLEIRTTSVAGATTVPARPASASLTVNSLDLYSHYGDSVFLGFTAATGAANQEHHIRRVYFNNGYISGGITPSTDTYIVGAAYVVLTASPTTLVANGSSTSTVTATLYDINMNVLSGRNVYFETSLGTLSAYSGVTNASGQVTLTFYGGSTPGTATVLAYADGNQNDTVDIALQAIVSASVSGAMEA